jgi:dephospho-CoA kinase
MILGITGTDGAGKGTVVDYLIQEKGFIHYSARALITAEIEKRGLPVDREHMRLVANDLRRLYGNDHLIRECLDGAVLRDEENIIVESIRETDAARLIKERGGILLAVDANQDIRYTRIQARASASDNVSLEEFIHQEKLEMNDPDPHGMQKAKVMEMADYTILNNVSLADLHEQIDVVLAKIMATEKAH